jgi:hypothetical protein
MEGEKMEVVHRDRKKLSSVFLYPKTIVTVDQHGSTQELPVLWMLDYE